jgi:hypothetical protein
MRKKATLTIRQIAKGLRMGSWKSNLTACLLFLTDGFTLRSPKTPQKSPYISTATHISTNDGKGLTDKKRKRTNVYKGPNGLTALGGYIYPSVDPPLFLSSAWQVLQSDSLSQSSKSAAWPQLNFEKPTETKLHLGNVRLPL